MPVSIGYEPNRGSSGLENSHAPRIPTDLIRVLPLLTSYKPSDRQSMKKSVLKMLKSIGCIWILENKLYSLEQAQSESSMSPLGATRRRQLFSPAHGQPITAYGRESAAYGPARQTTSSAYGRDPAAQGPAGTNIDPERATQALTRNTSILNTPAQTQLGHETELRLNQSSSMAEQHKDETADTQPVSTDEQKASNLPRMVDGQLQRPSRPRPSPLFLSGAGIAHQQPLPPETPVTFPAPEQGDSSQKS